MTEAAKIVENLLGDELPPSDIVDPKAFTSDLKSAEDAEVAALRKSGEVNPRSVRQYDTIYHRTLKNADGTAGRAKVTSIKTLKTRPDDWSIGWKHGLKTHGRIDKHNAGDWTTIEPPAVERLKRRR